MGLIPWMYELSYTWKSLVLSAYQSDQLRIRLNESNSAPDGSQISNKLRGHHEIFSVLVSVLDQKSHCVPYTLHAPAHLFLK